MLEATFKRYLTSGTITNTDDNEYISCKVKELIEKITGKYRGMHLVIHFIIEYDNGGSVEALLWPWDTIILALKGNGSKQASIYSIFYEVLETTPEALEFDLYKAKLGEAEIRTFQTIRDALSVLFPSPKTRRVKSRIDVSSIDVCIKALKTTIDKGCLLSSEDITERLDGCGAIFMRRGNKYVCVITGSEVNADCEYIVSIVEGEDYTKPHTNTCVAGIEELEEIISKSLGENE